MGRGKSIASLRNLPQFRGKTDEEILAMVTHKTVEEEVQERIIKLGEEYDLSDMKYHDMMLLERLFTAIVRLERAETDLSTTYSDLNANEKSREEAALSTLRNDIIRLQNELGIGRLRRSEQVEDNPIVLFSDIRQRAKKFLEDRLCWVICPICGMQLAKVHFTYPKAANTLKLLCLRCDGVMSVSSEELLNEENTNPYR